jgi:hypothetical protein
MHMRAYRYQLEQLKLSSAMMDKYQNLERKYQEEGGYFIAPILEENEHVSTRLDA